MGCFKDTYPQMKRIGFEYYRLINVFADFYSEEFEGEKKLAVYRDNNGKIHYDFSKVIDMVKSMKECGGQPYLILGETIPAALIEKHIPKTHKLPIEDEYIEFVAEALSAIGKNGIKNSFIYVEVGNEFDTPRLWYQKDSYKTKFENYLRLYKMTISGVKKYEDTHPHLPRVKVGGPASTCFGFAHTFGTAPWGKKLPFNFTEEFIRQCKQQKIRLDFIGFHTYTDQTPLNQELGENSYPDLNRQLTAIEKWRDLYIPNAEIIVSEWGFCGLYDGMGMQNYSYIAAASGMEQLWRMLQHNVERAIFLTMRLPNAEKYFPHLLAANGHPLPIYRLFEMIADLAPQRIKLQFSEKTKSINAIASTTKDNQKGTILIWNTMWMHQQDRKSPGYTQAIPIFIKTIIPCTDDSLKIKIKSIDMTTKSELITALSSQDYISVRSGKSLYQYEEQPWIELPQIKAQQGQVSIPGFLMLPESILLLEWESIR